MIDPRDQLWGHGKAAVCANYQHAALEEQVSRFLHYQEDVTHTERA